MGSCIFSAKKFIRWIKFLVGSEKTVRNHISNIFFKLQVNDRTQAVLYALRKGIKTGRESGVTPASSMANSQASIEYAPRVWSMDVSSQRRSTGE